MTPSGIEPATFLLVAQWLNQLRHRAPRYTGFVVKKVKNLRKEFLGCRRSAVQISAVLGCGVLSLGGRRPTFRNSAVLSYSSVEIPMKKSPWTFRLSNTILTEQKRIPRTKTCPSVTLFTTNLIPCGPASKPGLRGQCVDTKWHGVRTNTFT